MYLLDANVCIRLLNNSSVAVTSRLATEIPANIYLCTVVQVELYYGVERSSRREHNLVVLENFLRQFTILTLDQQAAQMAGQIRYQLAKKGTPIGPYDVLIAAIAIANNLILVTHNTKEFRRIDGLNIEDWEV